MPRKGIRETLALLHVRAHGIERFLHLLIFRGVRQHIQGLNNGNPSSGNAGKLPTEHRHVTGRGLAAKVNADIPCQRVLLCQFQHNKILILQIPEYKIFVISVFTSFYFFSAFIDRDISPDRHSISSVLPPRTSIQMPALHEFACVPLTQCQRY